MIKSVELSFHPEMKANRELLPCPSTSYNRMKFASKLSKAKCAQLNRLRIFYRTLKFSVAVVYRMCCNRSQRCRVIGYFSFLHNIWDL